MKSKIIASVSILLVALVFAVPALAGGWATITLEALPSGAIAGEPLTVRFVVRQHGRTLMEGLTPTISARNAETGESISIKAIPVEGQIGHYEASLAFDTPGTWEWRIQAFTMDQRMPDLEVTASAPEAAAVSQGVSLLPVYAGIAVLLIVLAATALAIRKQPRWALGLIILGVLVGGAGFASAAGKENKTAPPANDSQAASSVEAGRALFVAKGCVACHINHRIDDKYYEFSTEMGPNLSNYAASPEFLRIWLKDPATVRPDTKMPSLELSEAEIEALIAFLNGNSNPAIPPTTSTPEALQRVITATPLTEVTAKPVASQKSQTNQASACSNLDRSQGLPVSYSRDAGSYLTLVDPATGAPLCGIERIELGIAPVYAYAPDRSALVALSAESYAQRNWRLNWIDLQSWKSVDIGVILDAWSQGMAVDPQRTRIAIAYARLTKGNEPVLEGYNLVEVNVSPKGEKIEREIDISPRLVSYVGDGEAILVYGSSFDSTQKISAPPARLGLYRTSDLSPLWEIALDDVLDGIITPGDETNFEPDQMTQWQPALALSPDRDKLYIVHADADRLTTVDLLAQRWDTIDIQPRLSWLERLMRLTSSVAYAKVLNGTSKWAVLSPDGSRLYVTGFTGQPHKDAQGNWMFDTIPLGLQVIDTGDGSEIARIETEANEIDLSADGANLFLRGTTNNSPWTDVLAADSLETIYHTDEQLLFPAQTLSGEIWAVGSPQGQWTQWMGVFDQKGYTLVSEIKGNGYWVSTP